MELPDLPEEGHGALCGHGLGQQGLAGAGWSVQQDSGPVQTQRQQLGALQRKLNRIEDLLLHLVEASNVLPGHTGDLHTDNSNLFLARF